MNLRHSENEADNMATIETVLVLSVPFHCISGLWLIAVPLLLRLQIGKFIGKWYI